MTTGIVGVVRKKTAPRLKYAGNAASPLIESGQDIEMRCFLNNLVLVTGLVASSTAYSGEVKIVDVKVSCSSSCLFSVTLKHADEGWEHYVNQWDVMTMDGELLKSRVLLHPHVNEQPFTRSLSGVKIPAGTTRVKIRAKDLKHGYSSDEYTVDIPN